MNRRFGRLMLILIVLSFLNLFVRLGSRNLCNGSELGEGEYSAFIDQVINQIEKNYVDEIDRKKLLYGALHGMVLSVNDPHSNFIEPDAFKQLQQDTQGHFGGLGIVIGMRDGYLTVISTLEGKPAERAGVEADDRILAIDGQSTQGVDPEAALERLRMGIDPVKLRELLGITLPQAVNQLRGPVGKPVKVTFGKEGEEPREMEIKREEIDLESVRDVKIVEDGIGYIKLTAFSEMTVNEMNKAIDKLRKEGMRSLILDLRDNPGGLLTSAVGVADRFVSDGKLIVSTRGRKENQSVEIKAKDNYPLSRFPLAVLVNEYSASASEIVAGALQDWSCAIIIGKKTFGKGSVQNLIPLAGGAALKLTTSRYYSPKGRVIDKIGIEPDIVVEPAVEAEDTTEEQEDLQLMQAIKILKSFEILQAAVNLMPPN